VLGGQALEDPRLPRQFVDRRARGGVGPAVIEVQHGGVERVAGAHACPERLVLGEARRGGRAEPRQLRGDVVARGEQRGGERASAPALAAARRRKSRRRVIGTSCERRRA
jgi:hypothetical protein